MSESEGYSIDQLLAWCLEYNLIDSYSQSGDVITILQGNLRHELPADQAHAFLKGIFKNSPVIRTQPKPGGAAPGQGQEANLA